MCTVIGFKYNKKRSYLFENFLFKFLYDNLLIRGRDGIGLTVYDVNINKFKTKYINKDVIIKYPKQKLISSIVNIIRNYTDKISYVLIHSRAIPETENNNMLQPVRYKNIILIHNGLIYNDKDILPNIYNDKIDSLAIAYYINQNGLNDQIFQDVKGSYTVLYIDNDNNTFGYITNYQPLYKYTYDNNVISIYTNIEPAYLNTVKDEFIDDICIEDIKPYSKGFII